MEFCIDAAKFAAAAAAKRSTLRTMHSSSMAIVGTTVLSLLAACPRAAEAVPELTELPKDFDARSLVFGCADTVMDQSHCGSCWAFSVTGALTDRYCIWSGGRLFAHTMEDDSATLSPQPLLSCGEGDGACDGGSEGHAWNYFKVNGSLTCRRQQTQVIICDCAIGINGSVALSICIAVALPVQPHASCLPSQRLIPSLVAASTASLATQVARRTCRQAAVRAATQSTMAAQTASVTSATTAATRQSSGTLNSGRTPPRTVARRIWCSTPLSMATSGARPTT